MHTTQETSCHVSEFQFGFGGLDMCVELIAGKPWVDSTKTILLPADLRCTEITTADYKTR